MRLPFSAVVGQDTAKRALLLAATEPLLAGVLLRGDKGSAKTTLARGLAALLPGDAPFVELPLGAGEDRVIGALDLAALLEHGESRFRPGLLAAAHGGVLYVDEINLLADHLVDVLLDVAASGINRVERDGFSHAHPARFVLIASMNPEEGELRPQLLDRFGLAVDVSGLDDVEARVLAVRRQLAADAGVASTPDAAADAAVRARLARSRDAVASTSDAVIESAARLALAVGAEGLRADLMLCRAAAAAARLDGRADATVDDVRSVAELVLGHRRRRRPFDEPGIAPGELDAAWERARPPAPADDEARGSAVDGARGSTGDAAPGSAGDGDRHDAPATEAPPAGDRHDPPAAPSPGSLPRAPRRTANLRTDGRFGDAAGERGRLIRAELHDGTSIRPVEPVATAVAAATRRAALGARPGTGAAGRVEAGDLRTARRAQPVGSLIVFTVDASASMGTDSRMAATKSAVLGLLGDAYRRRCRVALVTFRGDRAEVVLRPTGSVEIATARLADVATGGATPLAAGIDAATAIVTAAPAGRSTDATVVVVTDGRATSGGPAPVDAARAAMTRLARTPAQVLVVDTERGPVRLGLAAELAALAGAECRHLDELGHNGLEALVRTR